jgi:hypothetical protein
MTNDQGSAAGRGTSKPPPNCVRKLPASSYIGTFMPMGLIRFAGDLLTRFQALLRAVQLCMDASLPESSLYGHSATRWSWATVYESFGPMPLDSPGEFGILQGRIAKRRIPRGR